MSGLISYGIGYTANSTVATSIAIQPPPVYAAGNLLVMGVMAANSAGGVAASAPGGWTAQTSAGAPLAVFTKLAAATESPYTVSLAASSCAAGFAAAYPASTLGAFTSGNSGSGVVSYTPAFPGGVTSGETVLMVTGAVDLEFEEGSSGYYNESQNINLPSGWTTDVPVFGSILYNEPASDPLPCAIGLAEITGSTGNPTITNPNGGTMYAGFLIITITGTAPSPFQVSATSTSASQAVGVALTVKALTGAASPAAISASGATATFYANGSSIAPQFAITPNDSGSIVYGALTENESVTSGNTFTANAHTTFSQNVPDTVSSAIYGTMQSKATTASTSVTLGGTAPDNAQAVGAAAEILAASGQSITEVITATVSATYPGQYAGTAATQTVVFPATPPAGSLLVAMVSANSQLANQYAVYPATAATSFTVTDTSGLTWTNLAQETSPGYAGVFIAQYGHLGSPPLIVSQAVNRASSF